MRVLSIMAAVAGLTAAASSAQSLKPDEVLSSFAVQQLTEPHAVRGADNTVHLAYELEITYPGKGFITINKVDVMDPLFGQSVWSLTGDELTRMTRIHSPGSGPIPPGGSATIFLDVAFAPDLRPPENVATRITATRQIVGPDGKPAPLPPDMGFPATFSFVMPATPVTQLARVIQPPLRGPRWMATNGCCNRITPHRGVIQAVNGVLRVPERFAIDWIQLDPTNRAFQGDKSKLSNWAYYGSPIYSVADGTVVNLYDGAAEQVPGQKITGLSPDSFGGNMVVVDIGGGAYAFYAHMQRGSLKVKLGDRVKAGQVLGLLGNTGNSTAPHLHFHLMDGPSPLDANGIPYVLTRFSSSGVAPPGDEDTLEEGKPVTINPKWTGEHVEQLPLDNQIVEFK
jgi:hypothetical protein